MPTRRYAPSSEKLAEDMHDPTSTSPTCITVPVRVRAPDLRALRERDSGHVLYAPVQQIQERVVEHPGRVEHTLGLREDLAHLVRRTPVELKSAPGRA